MTLSDVLPVVNQLSVLDKRELIRILAAELETMEDIAPLEPFKTYELATPYDCFGAAKMMMDVLQAEENRDRESCRTLPVYRGRSGIG